jgi:hypothetical protein
LGLKRTRNGVIMPIKDRTITNLLSFQDTTATPRQIAGLYFFQLLDCLVDLAYKVSADFRKRPQLYRDLGQPSIAETLAQLNAQYGTEINFLSGSERNEIYLPIFGSGSGSSTNGTDSFSRLRNDLVRAATAFAQGASDEGILIFRQGVRTSVAPFADYLLGLQGDSVLLSKDVLADLTEKTCYPILRKQEIAAIFGISKLVDVDYPYATDPAEDLLVEQISGQLTWQVDNTAQILLTRESISNRQRAALRGAEAIATIIDFGLEQTPSDADVDLLSAKCYTWGTALASLNGQVRVSQTPVEPITPVGTTSSKPITSYGQR